VTAVAHIPDAYTLTRQLLPVKIDN